MLTPSWKLRAAPSTWSSLRRRLANRCDDDNVFERESYWQVSEACFYGAMRTSTELMNH